MASALVGDTIRVQVTFRDWSTVDEGEVVDPENVYIDVLNAAMERTPLEEQVTRLSPGVYYFDWTPQEVGRFYLEFQGVFADGDTEVVREAFDVAATYVPPSEVKTLQEDTFIVFGTTIEPLYVDPEEFLPFYPEAGTVEVMELIHKYSLEVKNLIKGAEPSFDALEYIRAAVLCSLSKVYEFGVGGGEVTATLGDLSYTNRPSPARGGGVNRATASSWCELAGVLRNEFIRGTAGMKAVVKGSRHPNPMPPRHVRSRENGSISWQD